ncbi:MAG: MazG family protein, partial [Actinomycetes bacterium]
GVLFTLAGVAKLAGDDPEAAARTAARRFADNVRTAECGARAAGLDPGALTAAQWREHWPQ